MTSLELSTERIEQWPSLLDRARQDAQRARFQNMLAVCKQIEEIYWCDIDAVLGIGALLLNFGFVAKAQHFLLRAHELTPSDVAPVTNLANLAREVGNHYECLTGC